MSGVARRAGRESGQMSVEAAIMHPVLVVLAFVMANLMLFVEACVAFDRIAYDAVVTQGVSPAGEQTVESAEGAVESCIADALGREGTCEVEVSARDVGRVGGGEATFSVAPTLTTYECSLTFRPWGSGFSVAGASFSPPVELTHVRELTVDRFRPGVVV